MPSLIYKLKDLEFRANSRLGSGAAHVIIGHRNAIKNRKVGAVVTKRTDITIDGLQRSANTFFTDVFRAANPNVNLVHHMHCSGQVVRSISLNRPTILLVREPLSCVATMHALWPYISLVSGLDAYGRYYEHVMSHLNDVPRAVVAVFDEVIADPDVVIHRVNDRFGKSFQTAAEAGVKWRDLFKANDPKRETRIIRAAEALEEMGDKRCELARARALSAWEQLLVLRAGQD